MKNTLASAYQNIVVTGSNGFIGKPLIESLQHQGHKIHAWSRTNDHYNVPLEFTPNDNALKNWELQLKGIDSLIHLAGLAHQPRGATANSHFLAVNTLATCELARAACAAGVKRFIFLSSAKVFGEGGDAIYSEASIPNPQDAYAQSKWQAEQRLREQNAGSAMDLIILRPPLVYAINAKANFARLIQLALLPVPLPFAGIENRRAAIGLENLLDLISCCLVNPNAADKTLPCADAKLYSLPDMLITIRRAFNRAPRLFRMPKSALSLFEAMLGDAASTRLFGNFQMDCNKTYTDLNWTPPFSMEEILRRQLQGTTI